MLRISAINLFIFISNKLIKRTKEKKLINYIIINNNFLFDQLQISFH